VYAHRSESFGAGYRVVDAIADVDRGCARSRRFDDQRFGLELVLQSLHTDVPGEAVPDLKWCLCDDRSDGCCKRIFIGARLQGWVATTASIGRCEAVSDYAR
jgi:hypothetical protein